MLMKFYFSDESIKMVTLLNSTDPFIRLTDQLFLCINTYILMKKIENNYNFQKNNYN